MSKAVFVVVTFLLAVGPVRAEQQHSKPNVLFLCVDDMKDWVNCLGGYEGTVHTPNIDRLAKRGMLFTNAHCPSPKCAPSRAAIMTGLRPSTTGLYDTFGRITAGILARSSTGTRPRCGKRPPAYHSLSAFRDIERVCVIAPLVCWICIPR